MPSKPVDSKLQALVNFLLLTKMTNHCINHMIDSKHLAIVNFFAPFKKFTKARFDCTSFESPSMELLESEKKLA